MSELIIKIGDESLDLKSGEVIAITKQAAKVGDFSKVLADGTNQINVPATAHNKSKLDNSDLLQSDSNIPYQRLDATLIQEGYETLQDGFAIVESFSDNFKLQLVGGNASFFNLIKDLNLRDLDLSEYDHFWTNQNVFDNRNNTNGFIYALFEQSDQPTSQTLTTYGTNLYAVQTELLLPCFYVKKLIEKIFAAQNYDFVFDLSGETIYDNLVTFAASTPNRGSDVSYLNYEETNDTAYFIPDILNLVFKNASIVTQPLNFWEATSPTNPIYYLPDNCHVSLDIEINFNNSLGINQIVLLQVLNTKAGVDPFGTEFTEVSITLTPGASTYNGTFDFDCSASGHVLAHPIFGSISDYSLCFAIVIVGQTNVSVQPGGYVRKEFTFISNEGIAVRHPLNYIRGNSPVPDMKQGDFLKDLAKIFQLVYDVNETTHTVTARRFDKVKENIPLALDFSSILHDSDIDIKYGIDGFAQTNYLKWKPDDITKFTAEGSISVADTTLDAERVYVELSQFAATSTVSRFDTKNATYVPLFDIDQKPSNGMTDRLFIVRPETFPYNINFNRDTEIPTDLPTFDVTFAYFMEAGNTDSLDFPTLIERFYQTVQDMTYKAKSISCKVNLNVRQVMNYDPFIPVFIQKFNNYFYWEKLENYVKNKLTKIRLIKI